MARSFPRLFNLDEANQLLDSLRPRVAQMIGARDRLMELRPNLRPVLEKAGDNGGGKLAAEMLEALDSLRQAIETVQLLGVVVKDVNTGLVDFPSRREGREVFLCWRYGEERVAYWHDLDAGVAGRQEV